MSLADSINPIIVKSARARLRPKHVIPWAVVVLTITGFVCAIVYLVQTRQELATPEVAARFTIIPVIVVQAVVLMLLGTASVASTLAEERDERLMDYQRMTPMSPTAKILGHLFGLPIREYLLAALTLPFLLFGIIEGGFPFVTVAHFYLIFFSSVIAYHFAGMAAGIASTKPRRTGLIVQGLVLVLYFVLPFLSFLGLTFFEFLTIRPALFGLIHEEIVRAGGSTPFVTGPFTALDTFRDIPFYAIHLHPSLYTIVVQGSLVATMWVIVHRKWRNDAAHPLSKWFAMAMTAWVGAFLLGSVWPIITTDRALADFLNAIQDGPGVRRSTIDIIYDDDTPMFVFLLTFISAQVLGLLSLFLLTCTTASRHTIAASYRRAARLGHRRLPWNWDGASSLPIALGVIVTFAIVMVWEIQLAVGAERVPGVPSLESILAPIVYFAGVVLFIQGTLERFGRRVAAVAVFLLWVVPFFLFILLAAAFENEVAAAYVSLPCPPFALFYDTALMIRSVGLDGELGDDLRPHIPTLAGAGAALYAALAIGAQSMAITRRRRIARGTLEHDHALAPAA